MLKKTTLLLFLVHSLYHYAVSQENKFSGWSMYMHTIKITKNISSHLDIQLRSDDNLNNAETFIFRPGVNFHFRNKTIATLGYGLIEGWRSIDGDRGAVPEHRIWQQYIIPQQINRLTLNHRVRLEERFIPRAANQNGEIVKTETVYNTRLRYFFRSIVPLKNASSFEKGLFFSFQNEVFLNVSHLHNVNKKFFDQNRAFAGTGWRIRKELDVEAAYIYQFVSGLNSADVNNHIIQLSAYLRL